MRRALILGPIVFLLATVACGDDDSTNGDGDSGADGGSAGTGGKASGGSAGSGGKAGGSSGSGGSSAGSGGKASGGSDADAGPSPDSGPVQDAGSTDSSTPSDAPSSTPDALGDVTFCRIGTADCACTLGVFDCEDPGYFCVEGTCVECAEGDENCACKTEGGPCNGSLVCTDTDPECNFNCEPSICLPADAGS